MRGQTGGWKGIERGRAMRHVGRGVRILHGRWQACAPPHHHPPPPHPTPPHSPTQCSDKHQGSTLTFSLLDPSGEYLSWRDAARAMMEAGLHVRSGGMCNPGELCTSTGTFWVGGCCGWASVVMVKLGGMCNPGELCRSTGTCWVSVCGWVGGGRE